MYVIAPFCSLQLNITMSTLFSDLKNEPYRRADGVRRSQRKRVEMELTGDGDRK